MRRLYFAGTAIAALLVAQVVFVLFSLAGNNDIEDMPGEMSWTLEFVFGLSFILIVLAAACFLLAEFTRRGEVQQDRDGGMFGFGANRSNTGRVSVGIRVLWIVIGLLIWAALMLPLLLVSGYYAEGDLWMMIQGYGFFAAGSVGVMLTSLLKAAFYDRAVAQGRFVHVSEASGKKPRRQLPAGHGFWRFASYQFRIELWVGFAAGATLGLIPFALAQTGMDCESIFAECVMGVPSLVFGTAVAGAVFALAAVLLASQTWRSGEYLTAAESMASGPRAFQKSGG